MTQDQFTDAVVEEIFVRGFMCPRRDIIPFKVRTEWDRLSAAPDPVAYAERCVRFLGLTNRSPNPAMGIASATARPRDEWLAVHEAGHALVGVKGGMKLWGVRFYNDGFPGETLFDDPNWGASTDEGVLRREIRVDVAGNIAQLITPGCPAPQGLLSHLHNDRTPGDRPTDFISADARAKNLATILRQRDGRPPDTEEIWVARRAIVEQAEAEAEQILRENSESLGRLARELLRGPMTGAAVRAIVGG